jgi:predicted small secreted protein
MGRKTGIVFTAFILAFLLTACVPLAPSGQDVSSADYGKKPGEKECLRLLKQFGEDELKYPGSARYDIVNEPRKGWVRIYNSSHATFGWIFTAQINQKINDDGDRKTLEYVMLYRKGKLMPVTYKHSGKYDVPVNYPYGLK